MRGIIYALVGGACLTLQGVANARISQELGTWQTATITQLTGFLAALLILLVVRDGAWHQLRHVRPLYAMGGAFAAVIIGGNVVAIQQIGVTLTISALLIAQLTMTFLIDSRGWFGVVQQKMKWPHVVGIGMMIAGVVMLRV